MRRSIAIRALIILALGAATTVVIAWWLALRPGPVYTMGFVVPVNTAPPGAPEYRGNMRFRDGYRPGLSALSVEGLTPSDPMMTPLMLQRARGYVESTPLEPPRNAMHKNFNPSPAAWPSWLPLPRDDEPAVLALDAQAAGWPMLCLSSRHIVRLDKSEVTSGAVRLREVATYAPLRDSPLTGTAPLLPIWPGFLADSFLFALIWSPLVLIAPLRRALRRRRGLCAWCSYDRRGLQPGALCPECGASSPPGTSAS